MALRELDFCPTCLDLVRASTDTILYPSHPSCYPTYGSLRSSSKACAFCDFIASQWPHFESTLERYGVSDESIQSSQDGFPVTITMKAARKMHSGVSWTFWEAKLGATNTGLQFVSYFTLVACRPGGKKLYIPCS